MQIDESRLAKITWKDPETGIVQEYVLSEGATVTVGRSASNGICIPNQHVSRQHCVITYRDGIFMIADLNSSNGTFVNDIQLTEPFPLASGDQIRLYVPTLTFSSVVTLEETRRAKETGRLITRTLTAGKGHLIITTGPQENQVIPLLLPELTIGRATNNATWEIGLQDPSVSRPHARLKWLHETWMLYDLGSSNGTYINHQEVTQRGLPLRDGDTINFGATMALYRTG
ncbi:MAG: hypothetical protein OHK0046_20080 [Anaerolineae bacterium]